MNSSPRIVVLGAVGSTRRTLAALLRNNANVVGALGLSQQKSKNVSGYSRLDDLCQTANIPYHDFDHVNDPPTVAALQQLAPDLLFLVGLSQLANAAVLAVPTQGTVGFHPTALPKMRGRAPVAWLIMENAAGAATFFLMNEGVDAGPILAQAKFTVGPDDYASDVMDKLEDAIDTALDAWVPPLLTGAAFAPTPQNETDATYRGRRTQLEGLINWAQPAVDIYRLIRAAGRPHPGAYTHVQDSKLIIWRAHPVETVITGVVGRVLDADADSFLVQTAAGALRVTEYEMVGSAQNPRIGQKLGYTAEEELYKLRQRVAQLEQKLETLLHSPDA